MTHMPKVTVLGGEGEQPRPVVYLHMEPEEAARLAVELPGCVLVCVSGNDWNRDFSPWAAAGVFRAGGDFSGGAEGYLQTFRQEVMPAAEGAMHFSVTGRYIAGYSMAGLFALYSWLRGMQWDGVACCSGSVWFDGFEPWARTQNAQPTRLWMSVGDREKRTRNVRMQCVEDCARRLAQHWGERMPTHFQLEKGGHFEEPEKRILRGIQWMLYGSIHGVTEM